MKKEVVYMIQKVFIEYATKRDRQEAIRDLRDYPNSHAVGGGTHRFTKSSSRIKVINKNPVPMNITDNRIDFGKSLKKLMEKTDQISRDDSRTNLEKFVSLKYAVKLHYCECKVSDSVPAANPDDLKDINI